MNHIYRSVWNEITRTWVAAAEIVQGRGKRSGGSSSHGAAERAEAALHGGGLRTAQGVPGPQAPPMSAALPKPTPRRRLATPAPRPMALEQRFMFDGAAAVEGLSTFSDSAAQIEPGKDTARSDSQVESAATTTRDANRAQREHSTQTAPVLAFVDATLPDAAAVAAGFGPQVRVVMLVAGSDPWQQMTQAVSSAPGVAAIHLVSHGDAQALVIAGQSYCAEQLSARQAELQSWQAYLAPDADLLIYGCDVGAEGSNAPLLALLAAATGADVAASSDATGPMALGANIQLEVATGSIESAAASLQGLAHTLAATAVSDASSSTRTTAEDTEIAVTGLSITDADSPATLTLRVQTTAGTARIATLGSTTVTAGANASADFTLSGSLSAVNSALATLHFTPSLNQNNATSGFSPQIVLTARDVTNNDAAVSLTVASLNVTPVNDAPNLSTGEARSLSEGGSAALALAQLATSATVLDPDIATGQQVIEQLMMRIDSLPASGTLRYNGGAVVIGSVIPVSSLGSLTYTHTGGDIATTQTTSFNITVSDGGGGSTNGTISLSIAPANVAPTVSGTPSLIEGQVKVVAPTINLGDSFDTMANAAVVIDSIDGGGQGTFFIDADGDNVVDDGEALSGIVTLSELQRTGLATQLKFAHNGAEPNAPSGVSTPSYRISVTDAGGGTGTPASPVVATISLSVSPNNDDPTLSNAHATSGTAKTVDERTTTTITGAMLLIADADRNPSNVNTTTPAAQLVYTLGTRPTQGELQLNVSGTWVILGNGARFTQADVDAGRVQYVQTTNVTVQTADSFTFTVRDSAFGYDVWTDPANPTGPREGGLRSTPTGAIATQTFHLSITPVDPNPAGGGGPGAPTPGYGNLVYAFEPTDGMPNNNSPAAGAWQEGGTHAITSAMLSYTIKRTDARGTTDTSDDVTVTIPTDETVYTLTSQPDHGTLQRLVGSTWSAIATYAQFTQADINANRIRFAHDGSEDHVASFGYRVSDGTPNFLASSFSIDVTPVNDRPTATGGTAQVSEGSSNAVRLTSSVIGLSDADGSQEGKTGEGSTDFLWFKVTGLAVDGSSTARGTLQRWDGSSWVTLTTDVWLPSTLLSASADTGTSGLRYVHDGSEPLTYTGGPKVTFTYVVRDDLSNPGNALATNPTAPTDITGSAQSNESATVTATIDIVPVNTAPSIADKPGDADPTIGATIASGGATTGVNNTLTGVEEGAAATISSAHLTAIDPDNTTVQRQFSVTSLPTLGALLLNGKSLGVGSTFTQADIDGNKLTYRHSGAEVPALTTDTLGNYHDKFQFNVNDGVLQDTGSTFLITLAPANQAPTITGPSATVLLDSGDAQYNQVTGFTVADPDLTGSVETGETDFLQVTVRLLNVSNDTPYTNYVTGFAGGGVRFGYTSTGAAAGLVVTSDGIDKILQFQGSRAQVNAALAGLTVTFASDLDASYKLQVIVDDRMRDVSGALVTSGSDANGGERNKAATVGGTPTAVPSTVYDWGASTAVPTSDPNIAAATVSLRASRDNDAPTFTGPPTATVTEDVRTRVTGSFTVADAESAAFNTPVAVTISVPSGQGTVDVAGSGAQTTFTPSGGQAVTISGDTSTSLTLTGRAADIQALLNQRNFANTADDTAGGLFYTNATNANHDANDTSDGDVTLTLSFNDAGSRFGGDAGSGSVANNPANVLVALTIDAVNDAPVVNRTATSVTIADTTVTAVSGFSISDVDASDGYATGEADGTLQVLVRLLNGSAPLAEADYLTLGITVDSSAAAHGATVDNTLNGAQKALEIRGTLTQINAYLAGLQLRFSELAAANLDSSSYAVEVVADDRLRVLTSGSLASAANGGTSNQQSNLPIVPSTDTFDVYATTVGTYGIYNFTAQTRPLFISSINDPGSISASNVTVNEGSSTLVISTSNVNISIADPDDNGATTVSATVTVSTGTISAVGGSGGSVSGTGSATVTITGATEAELNSRLQALTIAFPDPAGAATAADWNGSFTVTVVYRDAGNTGTRPDTLTGDTNNAAANPGDFAYEDGTSNVLITTRTFTVTVNGVNDAPVASGSATLTAVSEDSSAPTGATVSDLFSGNFSDELDNVSGGTSANTLLGVVVTANAATASQGTWQWNNSGTWTNVSTSLSNSSGLFLTSATGLRFLPAANFNGVPGSLTVRLADSSITAPTNGSTVNVSGANNGAGTAYSASTVVLATSITSVNDAPVASGAATLSAIDEDPTTIAGATVSSLFAARFSDSTDAITTAVSGGSSAHTLAGIAVTGYTIDTAQGDWQFTTDGSTWTSIGTVSDTSALTLGVGANDRLRFVPAADFNGAAPALTVRLIESSASVTSGTTGVDVSANGGATGISSGTVALNTSITKRNDAPTLTHTATSPAVTENTSTGAAVSIDPVNLLNAGTVADIDLSTTSGLSSTVFGAGSITATLTDGISGDSLLVSGTLPTGVTISGGSGSTPLVITLAQATTISEVQNLLEAIQYRHVGDNPTGANTDLSRSYTIVVSDGNNTQSGGNAGGTAADANAALNADTISGTITITAVNDAPVVDLNGATAGDDVSATWTEGANTAHTALTLAASATLSDVDNANLTQMTLVVAGLQDGNQEVLNIGGTNFALATNASSVNVGSFLVSYVASTGTFTIVPDGSTIATKASFQNLLRGITYINNTDNPTDGDRTVTVSVTDAGLNDTSTLSGQANSDGTSVITINVNPVNDQPVITDLNAPSFFEDAINANPAVIASSITLTDIDSADYNVGSLTVSGLATLDTVALPTTATPATGNIKWAGTAGGNVEHHNGSAWVVVGTATGGAGANFVVSFNAQATPAIAKRVIESLTFANSSANPQDTRTLTLALNDGDGQTVQNATVAVTVKYDNDAPTMSASTLGGTYTERNGTALQFVSGTIAVTEPDGVPFWISGNAGFLSVTLDTYVTGDTLSVLHQGTNAGQIGVSGSTISYGGTAFATIDTTNNGAGKELRLTFTSATATPAAVQALLAQLRYSNTTNDDPTVGNNTDPSREFNVTLNDGGNRKDATSTTTALTATLTGTITITPTRDNPVVSATSGTVDYTENGSAVTVDSGLMITDADDTQLAGAKVQITANLRAGDVLAVSGTATGNQVNGTSITVASYDSSTGTLTLSGTDTLANYQAVLRSVTYVNTSDNPNANSSTDPLARTITFAVTDANSDAVGAGTVSATRTVSVTAVNDAPVIAGTASNPTVVESAGAGTGSSTVTLLSGSSVTDADFFTAGTNFGGGSISVSFTDAYGTGDVLSVASRSAAIGAVQRSGNNIQYSSNGSTWTTIGTVDSTSTGLAKALVINLNTAADQTNVAAVVNALTFRNTSDNPTLNDTDATRAYSIQINDGNNNNLAGGAGEAQQNSNALTGTIGFLRPTLSVSGVTVDEGSTATWTVTVSNALEAATVIDLALTNVTTETGDYNATYTVYTNPADKAGSTLTVTSNQITLAAGVTTFYVDVATSTDTTYEGPESLKLTASFDAATLKFADRTGTNSTVRSGASANDNSTLTDDGSGPDGDDTGTIADDDRPLSVNNVTASESSPFVIFTVTGQSGQQVQLALESGSATVGTDTGVGLQFFDGSTWRDYTPGSLVTIPSGRNTLLVRVTVVNDALLERSENFRLVASNTGGRSASGTGTLVDDGSSASVFAADNNSGQPTSGSPDNDTPPPQSLTSTPAPDSSTGGNVARAGTSDVGPLEPPTTADFRQVLEPPAPALLVNRGITDQFAEPGGVTTFSLPADAFAHTNTAVQLSMSARQANGSPLPPWLTFNPLQGTFQAIPPAGFQGQIEIAVTARDPEGREVTAIFKLNVGQGVVVPASSGQAPAVAPQDGTTTPPALVPQGRSSLTDQIRQAARREGLTNLLRSTTALSADTRLAKPLEPQVRDMGAASDALLKRILSSRAVQENVSRTQAEPQTGAAPAVPAARPGA
jgi:hypothetical protein